MKYCNVERPLRVATPSSPGCDNLFNKDEEPFETLGSRILRAMEQGADLGSPVSVSFDDDEQDAIDVLTDPNRDLEDLQNEFGSRSEYDPASAPVVETPAKPAAE